MGTTINALTPDPEQRAEMITDIPTAAEFENYALDYLNLSWEQAIGLLRTIDDYDGEPDNPAEFWKAAQRPLATAVSLCHQGMEFLLKSHIAAVSPYLLIKGEPGKWPGKCATDNVPFSTFYTLDAEDLVTVYNTVVDTRLPEGFKQLFNEVRQLRNSITHTVDNKLALNATDILIHILACSEVFFGNRRWLAKRASYMDRDTNAALYPTDDNGLMLAYEMKSLVTHLGRGDIIRYFGFDRKRRRYVCPFCRAINRDAEFDFAMAVLDPNTPESTTLYCFVCEKHSQVEREACDCKPCRGNVISEDGECLVCCANNW